MKPIFIAGPHGSGKTTLISNLVKDSDKFIKDDFQIDFSSEMESLSIMTIFEKCLIRLYHRFYTAEFAIKKCENTNDDKILIVDRSIYDSLVYIDVEYMLGELTEKQYRRLREITDNAINMIKPYTVILNPTPTEVVQRLDKRRATGARKKRDELCAREDNIDYIKMMYDVFEKQYSCQNVFHIENNEDIDIELIRQWIKEKVLV
jgi:thymidylate kinase